MMLRVLLFKGYRVLIQEDEKFLEMEVVMGAQQ